MDRSAVNSLSNHFAQAWNYRYSSGYGSAELAPSHPGVVGHELVPIAGVHVIDDRTVFVEMPDLQPVNQLHLVLQVDSGRPQEMVATVHRLDAPFTGFPGYIANTIRQSRLTRRPLIWPCLARLSRILGPNAADRR